MNKKPVVVYWNNIPTPYMVARFNALADHNDLNFTAWFNEPTKPDRGWEMRESDWRFNYRYVPSFQFFGRKLFFPPLELLRQPPDVLISLYAEPCFISGWLIARLARIKTAFWCQVTMDRWTKRSSLKNIIKKYMFRRVNATLGSGEQSRQYAIKCGADKNRAMCLPHVIDLEYYRKAREIPFDERDVLRREIGLSGVTFICIGRLWWGKGLGYLFDAFKQVQRQSNIEVSLLMIGDGPEESALKDKCKSDGINNVFFEGFIQKESILPYFAVSDAMVFPTLGDPYGLVLDEAMAAGLPLISSDAAGDLIDRIDNGVNGYIVPVEDTSSLAEHMLKLVLDDKLRKAMGEKSGAMIEGKTPSKWAKNFSDTVERILNMP